MQKYSILVLSLFVIIFCSNMVLLVHAEEEISFTELSQIDTGGSASFVQVIEDIAYIADDSAGFKLIVFVLSL